MISIPTNCITDEDKIKFLYRALELLRLEHNEEGKKFREGKISESQFRDYQRNSYKPRMKKIGLILNPIKEKQGLFKNEESPKWEWKEDGKKEVKWDNDINLTEI